VCLTREHTSSKAPSVLLLPRTLCKGGLYIFFSSSTFGFWMFFFWALLFSILLLRCSTCVALFFFPPVSRKWHIGILTPPTGAGSKRFVSRPFPLFHRPLFNDPPFFVVPLPLTEEGSRLSPHGHRRSPPPSERGRVYEQRSFSPSSLPQVWSQTPPKPKNPPYPPPTP